MPSEPMPAESTELRFGDARLDLQRRRLLIAGKPAKVGARAFDVLKALIERRARAVDKHELFDTVWPGLVVEENNLQVHISALRKLLGPEVIATIPGRGYQFTAALDSDAPAAPTQSVPPPLPAAPPPSAAVDPGGTPRRHGNVPPQREPILGRAAEIDEVVELLRRHPLVSIVGAGGIGKTRLALAVAAAVDGTYRDGVWWIELAGTSDAALVAAIVAQALELSHTPPRTVSDTLIDFLRPRQALLVLDNCEHLLDAVARLADALHRECIDVTVLATSQEVLKLPGEQIYRLDGMAVPAAGEPASADLGALALFTARAQAADPRLRFDAASLETAASICRALDGIPLAIELAAARVPLLGLEGLHQRLGERLRILSGGTRMALRRHQTLRAALEWSHSLLTDEERKVFRRLSVFAGGFALELAQAVAADDTTDRWQVVDLLGHLIDKSLVVADHGPIPRYRLLETTRAFALESLANAGETAALLRHHAEALAADLAAYDAAYWTQKPSDAERIPRELDNLRAALDWAESPDGDRTTAIGLLGVSYGVWHTAGQLLEGIERCRRALPLPAGLSPDIEARFWLAHGRLGYQGSRADCYEAAGRAAHLFRRLHDHRRLVDALLARALIGARRGELDAGAVALAEAESLVTPAWPAKQRAVLALAQAIWLTSSGRHEEALAAALRQAACYREEGLEFGVQLALSTAGFQEACLGRHEAAIARLSQAVSELRRLSAWFGMGDALGFLSFTHAMRGGPGDAARALSLAADAWPELHRNQRPGWLLLSTARAQVQLGHAAVAARLLGKVDALHAEEGVTAPPFFEAIRTDVGRSIAAELDAGTIKALMAEGAALSDDAAAALAFIAPATPSGRA